MSWPVIYICGAWYYRRDCVEEIRKHVPHYQVQCISQFVIDFISHCFQLDSTVLTKTLYLFREPVVPVSSLCHGMDATYAPIRALEFLTRYRPKFFRDWSPTAPYARAAHKLEWWCHLFETLLASAYSHLTDPKDLCTVSQLVSSVCSSFDQLLHPLFLHDLLITDQPTILVYPKYTYQFHLQWIGQCHSKIPGLFICLWSEHEKGQEPDKSSEQKEVTNLLSDTDKRLVQCYGTLIELQLDVKWNVIRDRLENDILATIRPSYHPTLHEYLIRVFQFEADLQKNTFERNLPWVYLYEDGSVMSKLMEDESVQWERTHRIFPPLRQSMSLWTNRPPLYLPEAVAYQVRKELVRLLGWHDVYLPLLEARLVQLTLEPSSVEVIGAEVVLDSVDRDQTKEYASVEDVQKFVPFSINKKFSIS